MRSLPGLRRLALGAAIFWLSAGSLPAQDHGWTGKSGPPEPVVLAPGARAGDPRPQPLPGVSRSCGAPWATLQALDGALWASGNAYKALFGPDGFTFTPALGRQAERNHPLSFRLESVGRGQAGQPVAAAEVTHQDLQVRYRRDWLEERYDVRPEGLEQSFVFDRLPPGSGDLVVRGRLATDLQVTVHGDGLRLELPGVGGMHIGGVTGIDAAGNRARGEVRCAAGTLELSLPAAFVEQATLPLVLDPLVGSVFTVMGGTNDDQRPDVAYDATNAVYLVVFERVYSASDHDIHGQRISTTGALVGSRLLIENATTNENYPAVANVNLRDRFVVVYHRAGNIFARSVDAATAAVSPEITVASGTDTLILPDVGGETTTFDDDAICVWQNTTARSIQAAQITVNADGTLIVWDLTTIIVDPTITPHVPRISKGGGATGFHMIVWRRDYSTADGDPQGRLVDRELNLLGSVVSFDGATTMQLNPTVDGDGYHWVVAWATAESGSTAPMDIAVRACSWDPNLNRAVIVSPIVIIEGDANDHEWETSVCWAGGSWLVGFSDQILPGGNYDTYFKSIDPFTCLPCEGEFLVNGALASDLRLRAASPRSGGSSIDEALVVIETLDAGGTNTSDIQGVLWRSADGAIADLGGGCGGGLLYATCARAGNATFAVRALAAAASAPAVLVISRSTINWPCGPCRLVPDPYLGFVVTGTTTNSYGQAQFAIAVPPDPGVTGLVFYSQWVVADFVTPSCYLFGSDLSPAVRLVIE